MENMAQRHMAILVLLVLIVAGMASAEIIDAYTEEVCTKHNATHDSCQMKKYFKPMFIDCNGWKKATDVIDVRLVDDVLVISECEKQATYKVFMDDNKDRKYLDEMSFIEKLDYDYKLDVKQLSNGVAWEINFTKFPADIEAMGFEELNSVKQDKILIDWADAKKLGYELEVIDDKVLYTDLPKKDGGLYFDPTITVSGASFITDTFVAETDPAYVFEGGPYISVAGKTAPYVYDQIAYIMLNTSNTNITTPIKTATLYYYMYDNGNSATRDIYNMTCTGFDSSTLTWSNQAAQCPTTGAALGSWSYSDGWKTLDVTDLITQHNLTYLKIDITTGVSASYGIFRSVEAVTDNPYLLIDYVKPGFFKINAFSDISGNPIQSFNATVDGVPYGTDNYSITTTLNYNLSNATIAVWSDGFVNTTDVVVNLEDDYNVSLSAQWIGIILINEKNATEFDVNLVTGAKAYDDLNHSLFDFKAAGTARLNYSMTNTTRIRIELEYADGTLISRYLDIGLIGSDNLRVCADDENATFHYKYIQSGYVKPAIMLNVYANCYVAGDYTRFATDNGYLLAAQTVAAQYYLYTTDDEGVQYNIAGLDGSIDQSIQLDILEFLQTEYSLNAYQDMVTFQDLDDLLYNNSMLIYYRNIGDDNTAVNIKILQDKTTLRYNSSTFADPNNVTIYFDYSTFNVTNSTVFQLIITPTGASARTVVKYFTTFGETAQVPAAFVFIVSLMLSLFALTLASSSLTFGWFGIFIMIANIAWCSYANDNIYLKWLLGLNIIILIGLITILMRSGDSQRTGAI